MVRVLSAWLVLASVAVAQCADKWEFIRKPTRAETLRDTIKANGYPNLEGTWHWIGPFASDGEQAGLDKVYPPETEFDLAKSYPGTTGDVKWQPYPDFATGKILNLAKLLPKPSNVVLYLRHEVNVPGSEPVVMPVQFGSDDSIAVYLNGKLILRDKASRPCAADQVQAGLELKPGKNELVLKLVNAGSNFEVYVQPELPKNFPGQIQNQLARNFPAPESSKPTKGKLNAPASPEADYYKITALPVPDDCNLEVGGIAMTPDGRLVVCTRRGEVWTITNPSSDDLTKIKFSRFAHGLHESLGLNVEDDKTIYVVQRPELTKLVDSDGDGKADKFTTICDQWGCSGDYHEYAFGLPRDAEGNFYITLNVGFGGGHQAKVGWRGWCVKVSPQGKMEPYAYGLRSPNGVTMSPNNELFYSDNQGEWVASNKLHHLKKGEFFGHQAGLVWLKDSPFFKPGLDKVESGMLYDGKKSDKGTTSGMPKLSPPAIWFPYGRMGQSASEPRFDTTAGKFGPFAGQCFVGDQSKSIVMRVAMEKVNGVYQGACFPFRAGFQCGVNRIFFGPDGALYVGETARGWGSLGSKQYGLERVNFTGATPFEMHHVNLTKSGFTITFTKPLAPDADAKIAELAMRSYTYIYHSAYGCPETDSRAEKVLSTKLSADRLTATIEMPNLKPGRVYEFRFDGVKDTDGKALLHPEAYYTLNELVQ